MLIAIVRRDDSVFMMHELESLETKFFEVLPGDSYLEKEYSQVTFSDFNEETSTSEELCTMTVSHKDDAENKQPLRELEFEEVVTLIHAMYGQNADFIEARRTAVSKH